MKSGGLAFIKIIIGVLALFAVLVVGYQVYKYNFVSIRTESAVMSEMEKTFKTNGIFYRNETVVDNSGYDYLDVIRSEGERIASGGVVARVYSNEKSAKDQNRIRELEEKISVYEEVLDHSGSYKSASAGIEQDIYADLKEISLLAEKGDSDAFSTADDLIIEIMKKKIALGDLVQYDGVLKELRGELNSLKKSAGASVKTITTSQSGYFSLGTDGLEGRFSTDELKNLTVENYDSALKNSRNGRNNASLIGKVVYDSNWYVAMKVPANSIARLEAGNTVYIRIPSFGSDRIKCTVSEIRKGGKESILILKSSVINQNILTLRNEEINLIVETFSGIRVRQDALRKVDGKDGVYVKVGLLLRYKEVKILHNDGTNAIVEYDPHDNKGIRVYDQVVYKGSDLYSGKAVSDG